MVEVLCLVVVFAVGYFMGEADCRNRYESKTYR